MTEDVPVEWPPPTTGDQWPPPDGEHAPDGSSSVPAVLEEIATPAAPAPAPTPSFRPPWAGRSKPAVVADPPAVAAEPVVPVAAEGAERIESGETTGSIDRAGPTPADALTGSADEVSAPSAEPPSAESIVWMGGDAGAGVETAPPADVIVAEPAAAVALATVRVSPDDATADEASPESAGIEVTGTQPEPTALVQEEAASPDEPDEELAAVVMALGSEPPIPPRLRPEVDVPPDTPADTVTGTQPRPAALVQEEAAAAGSPDEPDEHEELAAVVMALGSEPPIPPRLRPEVDVPPDTPPDTSAHPPEEVAEPVPAVPAVEASAVDTSAGDALPNAAGDLWYPAATAGSASAASVVASDAPPPPAATIGSSSAAAVVASDALPPPAVTGGTATTVAAVAAVPADVLPAAGAVVLPTPAVEQSEDDDGFGFWDSDDPDDDFVAPPPEEHSRRMRPAGRISGRWAAMRRGERVNVVLYALTGVSIVAMTLEFLAGPDSLPTDVTTTPSEAASNPAPTVGSTTTVTFTLPQTDEPAAETPAPVVTRAPSRAPAAPAAEEPAPAAADPEPETPAPTSPPATAPPTTRRPAQTATTFPNTFPTPVPPVPPSFGGPAIPTVTSPPDPVIPPPPGI